MPEETGFIGAPTQLYKVRATVLELELTARR